jgi:capsid portal protein
VANGTTEVEALHETMSNSKGLGNFKNLFFYAPNGMLTALKSCRSVKWQPRTIFLTSRKSARQT